MLSVLQNFKMTRPSCVMNCIYVDDIMEILQFNKKGIHIDKTEKFYICKETIKGNQLKDKHTVTPIKYLKQY
jgi:hypothetical protein